MPFTVRVMQEPDLEAVAALTTQVEPEAVPALVAHRLRWLVARAALSNAFFVASCERCRAVIGFGHVHGVQLLGAIAYAEIASLVVDHAHQRRGVGRMLVTACERWAQAHGFPIVRLRPGRQRPGPSHDFYRQLGYVTTTPTAAVLHKAIGAS